MNVPQILVLIFGGAGTMSVLSPQVLKFLGSVVDRLHQRTETRNKEVADIIARLTVENTRLSAELTREQAAREVDRLRFEAVESDYRKDLDTISRENRRVNRMNRKMLDRLSETDPRWVESEALDVPLAPPEEMIDVTLGIYSTGDRLSVSHGTGACPEDAACHTGTEMAAPVQQRTLQRADGGSDLHANPRAVRGRGAHKLTLSHTNSPIPCSCRPR